MTTIFLAPAVNVIGQNGDVIALSLSGSDLQHAGNSSYKIKGNVHPWLFFAVSQNRALWTHGVSPCDD